MSGPSEIELSVVVPALNEERRLAASLEKILGHLEARGSSFEVLVVDDGSRDGTGEAARRFAGRGVELLTHPRRRGKGAAVRTGLAASRGRWVLLTDADLSAPITELERLEAGRAGADAVVGSRAVAGAVIDPRQPRPREWMGKAFNLLLRLLRLTDLRDTQCGFKLMRGDLARREAERLEIEGFAYDVELLWRLRHHGARIREVGVRWGHVGASKVRIRRDPLDMLLDVLALRWKTLSRRRPGPGKGR